MAITFGISSREEAEEYLRHPVLGARLRECTGLVNLSGGPIDQQDFRKPGRPEIQIVDDLVCQRRSGRNRFSRTHCKNTSQENLIHARWRDSDVRV